ncbi:hypothetical protein SDRG_01932 [Saprolegnia diclina VS20]|uniref:Uncharacterized protein n=1 Tax=Saprolegnia diclina (strain VS20) TaxID=1156394 RepID=T0R1M3_SAPDV|nr:hypothetical protein SDRG_01932 [Saprolegnia diclina VS20]EQC40866.1 hypothetical protein SDRG_01932 [Saprolegnia diclina VS20]|eukprot:XP_008605710.1 hypothetical protein SDRG_01932 [Saprolegnia diclina VS20]
MMQTAAKAVRQRWPVAATVTATATALALAGLQAYGGKSPVKANDTATPRAFEGSAALTSSANPNAPPSPVQAARPRRASLVQLDYFRFLLIPVFFGLMGAVLAVANYFDALNRSHYPSLADMVSRCILWAVFALQTLTLWPLLTRTSRLRSFRANLLLKAAHSRKLSVYFGLQNAIVALTVWLPFAVLAFEAYTEMIQVSTLQLYALLAVVNALLASVQKHIYTLIQLNPELCIL